MLKILITVPALVFFVVVSAKYTRNYSLQKYEHCSSESLVHFVPDVPEKNLNHVVTIGGSFEIYEKLYGPIDISAEISRCTLDMKTCETFMNFNIRNCCAKFKDPNQIYSKLVERVIPPLKCPLTPGNYTVQTTDVDLRVVSFLPMDGFVYTVLSKIITTDPVKKTRITASCVIFEGKIVQVRV